MFLAQIESASKPIVQKAVSKVQMSSEDKEVMSVFIAFLMNRVPDFEKSVNKVKSHVIQKIMDLTFLSEERAEASMKRYVNTTGDQSEVSAKDLVEFHKSGAYTLEIHRNESLRLMLELSVNIAKYLVQMDWIIFHAPKKTSFVTSDNPVFILPPKDWDPNSAFGVGLITPGARKVVPITQGECLVIYDYGDKIRHSDLNRNLVRSFNKSIASNSDRFLIGRDEALVRNLAQTTKLAKWKNNGRIQIC